MSGTIRKAISRPISRCLGLIEEVQNFSIGNPSSNEDSIVYYKNRSLCAEVLENRISTIHTYLSQKLEEWNTIIHSQIPPKEAIERELAEYEKMLDNEKGLSNVIHLAEDALNVITGYKKEATNFLESLVAKNLPPIATTESRNLVKPKLPQLELGIFSGNVLEWVSFRDTFLSLIHSQNLAPVSKLIYLKKALRGEALKLLEGIQVTDQAYQVAWDILNNRYGDQKILKSKLYDLLSSKSFYKKDIMELQRSLESLLRNMQIMGEDLNQPSILNIIENNLPAGIVRLILRDKTFDRDTWNLEKLRNFLDKHVKEQEIISRHNDMTSDSRDRSNPNFTGRTNSTLKGNKKFTSALTMSNHAAIKKANDKRQTSKDLWPKCAFCKNNHWSDKCAKVISNKERKNILIRDQCCLKCLNQGHLTKDCRKTVTCYYCKKSHNSAICDFRSSKVENDDDKPQYSWSTNASHIQSVSNAVTTTCTQKLLSTCCDRSLLMCRKIEILNSSTHASKNIIALFDSGAQSSYILTTLYHELMLPKLDTSTANITGFGDYSQSHTTHLTKFKVKAQDGSHVLMHARTITKITPPLPYVDCQINPRCNELKWGKPHVLIGADFYFKFIKDFPIESQSENHYIVNSRVGPMLAGSVRYISSPLSSYSYVSSVMVGTEVSSSDADNVTRLWSLESIGIVDSTKDIEDEEAYSQFKESLKIVQGRYSVCWPWKTLPPNISRNFGLAYGRLKSIWNKYKTNPIIWDQYDSIIRSQLVDGVVEIAPAETEMPTFYTPHLPVIKNNKVRIVYDASSADKKGLSLNDNLYRGPINTPLMVNILLRIREGRILLMADIEKAFHQIGLHESQRDVTRFIWLKDIHQPPNYNNLLFLRFTRIPFGVKSSPFLLGGVIRHHLETNNTLLSKRILSNLYVDNVFLLTNDIAETLNIYRESHKLFQMANMNLRMFISSNTNINHSFESDHCHPILKDPNLKSIIKVLGIEYDFSKDNFHISITKPAQLLDTKRKILQYIASIFDPLGWIAPILVSIKNLIQRLWAMEISWDESIPKAELKNLEKIFKDWDEITFKLPRYIPMNLDKQFELHCFVDASSIAYAAVVYRVDKSTNGFKASLIMSKVRIGSSKLTIPKMELMGVTIGAKLLKFVNNALQFKASSMVLWSDSTIVLSWLRNTKEKNPIFVKNRIKEIMSIEGIKFLYVPTSHNVADIATKPISPKTLHKCTRWFIGPPWLGYISEWPKQPSNLSPINLSICSENLLACTALTRKVEPFKFNIELPKCSTWKKLINSLGYLLKFIIKLKKNNDILSGDSLEVTSKRVILSSVQAQTLTPDMLEKWDLHLNADHLYAYYGRIISEDAIIWLPDNHWVTSLVILSIHAKLGHSGVSHVLSYLRRTFWIPKGRSTVKRIITNSCMICKRWHAKPFKLPDMPSLPIQRTSPSRPFEYVGIDLFGPILTKQSQNAVKRWVVLITCLVTRAVNLHLVLDMSSHYLMLALRRFFARWGIPSRVLSDNAKNFQMVSAILEQIQIPADQVKWKFIAAHSPWQGGIYERLIGITKNCLKKVVGKKFLSDEEFRTILYEVEFIVNSRPITYVPSDNITTLSPIDLIHPSRFPASHLVPIINPTKELASSSTRLKLINYWTETSKNTQKFWKIWQQDYLNALRERTIRKHRSPKSVMLRDPVISEVVLLKYPGAPRATWKLARIIDLDNSKTSIVRNALLRLPDGSTITRPICFLYPLEVTNQDQQKVEQPTKKLMTETEKSPGSSFNSNINKDSITLRSRTVEKIINLPTISQRTSLKIPFFLTILCILNIASSTTVHLCSNLYRGKWFIPPSPLNCSVPMKEDVSILRASVYYESFATLPSIACSKIERKVCTRAFFRLFLSVVEDRVSIHNVSTADCRQLNLTMAYDGKSLEKTSNFSWITNNPTSYNYGWLGTHCQTTVNYKLEKGTIRIHGKFHDSQGCSTSDGLCMSLHETVVWNPKISKDICQYEHFGNFKVYLTKEFVKIPELQSAFLISNNQSNISTSCGFQKPLRTVNSAILDFNSEYKRERRINNQKKKVIRIFSETNTNRVDPNNPKFQYLYNELAEKERNHTKELMNQICLDFNTRLKILKWISIQDPTAAVRVWLNNDGVMAENYGGKLLVKPCKSVIANLIATNHSYMGECYKNVPVLVGSKLGFLKPLSRDVIWVSEKINCSLLPSNTKPIPYYPSIALENKNVIFFGQQLPDLSQQKLSLTLQEIQELKDFETPDHTSSYDIEIPEVDLLKEGEIILREVGHQLNKASSDIVAEIYSIASYWRWWITAALMTLLSCMVLIIFYYCSFIIAPLLSCYNICKLACCCKLSRSKSSCPPHDNTDLETFKNIEESQPQQKATIISFNPTMAAGNVGNIPK